MISFEQFKETEIRIGEIISAEKVEGADKLLKLMVHFGMKVPAPAAGAGEGSPDSPESTALPEPEKEIRQIISGIAPYFPELGELVGVKCAFATNLEPRTIRGLESNGMILAAGGGDEPFTLLRADPQTLPGAFVK